MNRQQLARDNRSIQRKYEDKYHPPVARSIQTTVNETISAVKSHGVHGGITYLHNKLLNPGLTAELWKMDKKVGQRFARKQWISFQQQKRTSKGFGYNAEWVQRLEDLLYAFIAEQSFSIFSTTKDVLLTQLNKAITEGWGVD